MPNYALLRRSRLFVPLFLPDPPAANFRGQKQPPERSGCKWTAKTIRLSAGRISHRRIRDFTDHSCASRYDNFSEGGGFEPGQMRIRHEVWIWEPPQTLPGTGRNGQAAS